MSGWRGLPQEAASLYAEAVALRRDFHAHPEPSFQEHRTAERVTEYLDRLGLKVIPRVGKTGVVALLEGGRPGRTVLLRADMDALPIEEQNEVPYRSQTPGWMHACGHDGHTTIGLLAAKLLAQHREKLPGQVKFAFQPAEEIVQGAQAMIADGVLDDPPVEAAFGLHLWSLSPVGELAARPGPILAANDTLHVRIHGRGGHGAMPHQTADPIVAAAETVLALQTIVSRSVPPEERAVLSVGTLHGGSAVNVIPQTAELSGTIRTMERSVQKRIHQRVRTLIEGIAQAYECRAEVEIVQDCPAVVNDPEATRLVAETAQALYGPQAYREHPGLMASEDMAFFLQRVPGCFFFLGAAPEGREPAPHHHPQFDINERALPIGAAMLAALAWRFLEAQA
ncbi:MAG: amidohydrolase [Candidatus Poribacteria bacterium]|nr:MAG: amidohydrolase [Candidatus Poribacteria bacterium]